MSFCRNLQHYRLKQSLSGQQAAAVLQVPPETLADWESGKAEPEMKLLPRIAQLYGITVDDLFRHCTLGYDNHAQKLAAIFDSTRDPRDFAHAQQAFRLLQSHSGLTKRDLQFYPALQQTMLEQCLEETLALYREFETRFPGDPDFDAIRQRHMHLLISLSRRDPALEQYLDQFAVKTTDPEEWLGLISAFQDAGRTEEALTWLNLARLRFPGNPMLCYWGGTLCQALGRWEDALGCWKRALQLDPEFTDAAYACAECQEKLGDAKSAWKTWDSLARRLEKQGFHTEAVYPTEQARHCRSQLGFAFT